MPDSIHWARGDLKKVIGLVSRERMGRELVSTNSTSDLGAPMARDCTGSSELYVTQARENNVTPAADAHCPQRRLNVGHISANSARAKSPEGRNMAATTDLVVDVMSPRQRCDSEA